MISVVIGAVLVGLFAALVAFIVRQSAVEEVSGDGQLDLVVAADNGGIPVGSTGVVGVETDEGRVRLDVYFDFMCPYCGLFEQTQGATLEELRADGTLDVYYHPLGYLDGYSQGTDFSTRAASASALVAQEAPEAFLAFVEAMFVNQPEENTTGLTDVEIQSIASAVGVADEVVARIPDHEFTSWVRSATERASQDGLAFTPQLALEGVFVNPQVNADDLNWAQDGALKQAILDAAAA